MAQTQPSYFIQDVDAWMSRDYWNRLEPGGWMLDPVHPYRPAAVFGRTTGPAYQDFHIPNLEFVALTQNLNVIEIAQAGYAYLYLDRKTWQTLSPEQKQAIRDSCVHLISEKKNEFGDFRRLYDISRCKIHPWPSQKRVIIQRLNFRHYDYRTALRPRADPARGN